MEELKPCPLCGGKMKISISHCITSQGNRTGFSGYCESCGMSTRTKFTEAEAIADTNRRAAPENKALTMDELRKMDGEPVWIVSGEKCGWAQFGYEDEYGLNFWLFGSEVEENFSPDGYRKTWLAYARKPEGSETDG